MTEGNELMSIADAREALLSERRALQRQIDLIDEALAVLGRGGAKPSQNGGKGSGAKKTSRADLTQAEALDRYGVEALTCPECGKIARAPQGMKAHLRSHSS
ncbi:MAG TPA: hypothetical protein VIW46_05485 [Acidimicrobiia bacterium]|jgi:hypothetical protein